MQEEATNEHQWTRICRCRTEAGVMNPRPPFGGRMASSVVGLICRSLLERSQKCCSEWNARKPLTRPPATLSPSDGERDGVRGCHWIVRYMFHATALV